MASFSDAHECDEIPIIAANMHRMILPRQSQIWAVVKAGQPLQKLYYQICSGLLGRLCFSGEPDALSAAQWTVMDEGTAFYGKAASIIDHGVSQRFGSRIVSYRAPRGWQAVVRRGETQTLVVVHTFGAAPEAVTLPVGGGLLLDHYWSMAGKLAWVERLSPDGLPAPGFFLKAAALGHPTDDRAGFVRSQRQAFLALYLAAVGGQHDDWQPRGRRLLFTLAQLFEHFEAADAGQADIQ